MYNFFKDNLNNYYFSYSKENNEISSSKINNAISNIINENSSKLLFSVDDENIFLLVSFHFGVNLFSYLNDNSNKNNFIYNSVQYGQKNIDLNINKEYFNFLEEYKKHKKVNALKIFGDKFPNYMIFNNDFFSVSLLFLNNNILNLKKQTHVHYLDQYTTDFSDYCLFSNRLEKTSEKNKYKCFKDNITFGDKTYLFKNLLKLRNKKPYSILSNNLSIDNNFLYYENLFLRLSDFNIDIKKYKNLFDLGNDNSELLTALKAHKTNSFNNFKKQAIEKIDEMINNLNNRKLFINDLNF